MEFFSHLVDIALHLDKHLVQLVADYGVLSYGILFVIIFAETGFVVTPFLPGDSLLFAVGAVAGTGGLDIVSICILLILAGFLGNTVNYSIGRKIGPMIYHRESRFIKREYLLKAQAFFEKHGSIAVIGSRFLPIFRTFVPFVAGIGQMNRARFLLYNFVGAVLWVLPFVLGGYFFGQVPAVKNNFTLVIVAILVVTVMPAAVAGLKEYRLRKKAARQS